MEFDREVFDLMPSGSKTFNLIGLKMPSDKDIFFRAKQKETLDKYQAARRFMYELETDDWDHYFHKLEDENGNIYFQNVLKAQWYEAALLFYNAVVDLSWIACYISAEYFIYVDGKPVEVEGLTPIEEAYNALRKAEGYVQHPGVDGNPFEYLRKMCPQFSDTLDFVIAFWKDFADTPVRWKYNYLKHKGEHHPCFELFYRNTGGFLFGKPCDTRLSVFLCMANVYRETSKLRRCFHTPASLYEHGFSI